jgi:putative phosphoesterase
MKIGIISDIHGYPENFKKALELLKGCEMILCAGDILYHGPRNPILDGYNPKKLVEEIEANPIPILFARGNCDAEVDLMVLDKSIICENIFYEKDGIRFIVIHGQNESDERMKSIANTYKADVFISGHTHIRKLEKYEKTIFINPGSISVPKGDGIPSVAIYEDGVISFLDIRNGECIGI